MYQYNVPTIPTLLTTIFVWYVSSEFKWLQWVAGNRYIQYDQLGELGGWDGRLIVGGGRVSHRCREHGSGVFTAYPPHTHILSAGGIRKKQSALGNIRNSFHRYLTGGAYYVDVDVAFRAQFQILILACFSQTTNYCLVLWHFGSVKPGWKKGVLFP